MKQYPSIPVSEIHAAGGLGPWLLKAAKKGLSDTGLSGTKNARQGAGQGEKQPLPPCWQRLLDMPGVTEKPTPGTMNAWEKEHARTLFDRHQADEISGYYYERFRFEIGHRCLYIPDFVILHSNGTFGAEEVKGFMRDDANVKIKVAARMYPQIVFTLWTKKDGDWTCKAVRK